MQVIRIPAAHFPPFLTLPISPVINAFGVELGRMDCFGIEEVSFVRMLQSKTTILERI
jgi:hypothetical protein